MTQTDDTDLFDRPSGSVYPKIDELEGQLVLVKPIRVETVPGYQGKGTTERITADVHVYDDESGTWESYEDMYLSQLGLVPALKKKLKPGVAKPFVLGRITMAPSKPTREKGIDTPEALKKTLEEWARKGGKGDKPQFAWIFGEYTDADAVAARQYLATMDAFTS
jgi:hypothetical protein